jgi:anti-anti-sigma factor
MEVKHEERGAVTVASITGSLDATTAPQLTEFFTRQLADGRFNLVADLTGLDYTSSAGLRVLLNTTKQARQRGGDVRLAAAQANVKKVFELSGFTSIMKFYPDVQSAVASYKR